jgi:hypothetical protein
MHSHAAIVTGLVCSEFNYFTNKLEPGSLTMDDFRNGDIKSCKKPYTTVSDHLDQIMSKQFNVPMFQNQFHLSAYVPKQTMNAADLIEATRLQSLWISTFNGTLANTTISKVLANWFESTLYHSAKETRKKPSHSEALANGQDINYQKSCRTKSYKKRIHPYEGKDQIPYGYPVCSTGVVWDAYINNPFDLSTRKKFLSKISLSCND